MRRSRSRSRDRDRDMDRGDGRQRQEEAGGRSGLFKQGMNMQVHIYIYTEHTFEVGIYIYMCVYKQTKPKNDLVNESTMPITGSMSSFVGCLYKNRLRLGDGCGGPGMLSSAIMLSSSKWLPPGRLGHIIAKHMATTLKHVPDVAIDPATYT